MPVKSKAKREEAIRRGLCSAAEEKLFTDDDAFFPIETADIKRLSRFHMEYVLWLLGGSTTTVYFEQSNNSIIDTEYDGKPNIATGLQ